jgi:hypothetical protein
MFFVIFFIRSTAAIIFFIIICETYRLSINFASILLDCIALPISNLITVQEWHVVVLILELLPITKTLAENLSVEYRCTILYQSRHLKSKKTVKFRSTQNKQKPFVLL